MTAATFPKICASWPSMGLYASFSGRSPHLPVAAGIALDRGLVPQQGHHDLAVVSGLLLRTTTRSSGRIPALSMDSPRTRRAKYWAAVAGRRRRSGSPRCTPPPEWGYLRPPSPQWGSGSLRQRLRQGQRPALAGPLADDPQLLHVLQVKMDGRGGFSPTASPISRTEGG